MCYLPITKLDSTWRRPRTLNLCIVTTDLQRAAARAAKTVTMCCKFCCQHSPIMSPTVYIFLYIPYTYIYICIFSYKSPVQPLIGLRGDELSTFDPVLPAQFRSLDQARPRRLIQKHAPMWEYNPHFHFTFHLLFHLLLHC